MTTRPFMPLWIADYLADTAHLNAQQSGAYLHLIMHYWQHDGLPDNDAAIARIAKLTSAEWRRERPVLVAFFRDGWRHKRIDAELAHAADVSSKRRASGAQGRSKRSAIASANAPTNAPANADAIAPANEGVHARGLPQPHPQKEGNPAAESTSQPFAGFAKKPAAGRKANGQAGQAAGSRYPAWFEAIWAAYRPIASPNSSKSRALTAARRLSEADREDCRAGLAGYVAWLRKARGKRSDFPAQHLATFINGRGWEAFSELSAQAPPPVTDAELQRIVDTINAEREREETDDLAH